MSENWNSTNCPHCGSRNFIYQGDPSNFVKTYGSEWVCQCWKCKKKFWRESYKDFGLEMRCDGYDPKKTEDENLELMEFVKGKGKPR